MRNVLVLRFSSLGDVVLLTALIEALARQQPPARVWLATKRAYAPLFAHDPRIHQVVTLEPGPRSLSKLVDQLEDVTFDRILDAHGSLRSRQLTWRLPPAPTARIAKGSLARMLFVRTRWRTPPLARHQIDRYLGLLDPPTPNARPRVIVSGARHAEAERQLDTDAPVLAIAPGARHAPKQWAAERFAAVGARLVASHGARVVVVGGPGEEELCARIAADIDGATAMAGTLELDLLAAVLQRCTSVLCNDSGLMHLAEAMGTPVLALFGPTSRELGFFPGDPGSEVVEHTLPCRPCSRTGARPCHQPENWCLTRSTVDLVSQRLEVQWHRILDAAPATSI